jgi:hypothetical protein
MIAAPEAARKLRMERYHILVDLKLDGAISAAESRELENLKNSFDPEESDATLALRAERERNRTEFDAELADIRTKMKQLGVELPHAADLPKSRTARNTR